MDKIERIQELIQLCNYHCNLYYNENKPEIDNREYNLLFDELKALEDETGIILSNSPTQRAGYEVVSDLPKVKHEIPLLSLDKIKEVPKLIKWLGDKQGVLMLKMDGGTGKLTYKRTSCRQLVTRGDSETNIGEDVSHNIGSIKNIPLYIDDPDELQITGENFMRYSSFNELNAKVEDSTKKFSHPRNVANGAVGLLDSKLCKERNIEFCAFNILNGNKFITKQEQLEWLKSQGFFTVQYWMVTKDNLKETIETIIDMIPTFDFPIDGLVLSYNDIAYGESLGKTSHHYNSGISFKFEDAWYNSTYDYTEWNTSRNGRIVPKGIFLPIQMEGANHDRATLHNLDRFRAMQLGHADSIQVSKRNKIIPAIENNITRSNTEAIPTTCPTCGWKVEEKLVANTHDLYCTNPDCDAKLLKKLKHFVSKQCFNISDMGEATLDTFIDNGFIENYMDIFKIARFKKEILALEGFGQKSFDSITIAIEKSKQIEMASLITALGIPNVGFGSSKRIAKYFNNNIDSFLKATTSYLKFINIEDVGEITAYNIYDYFQDEDNMKLFMELLQYITIKTEEKKADGNLKDLTGLTFVVTGTVITFKNRNEVEELITSLGGKLSGSVSKNTNYLLNNDVTSTSGKNQKAKELNVPIISESDFNLMIGRNV